LYEVAKNVEAYRLPELFCGFEKTRNEGIVNYPVACSPQAWAVGCSFLLLQACLGIRILARENTVVFYKPTLPDFMNEVTLTNLRVNESTLILQARKSGTKVLVSLLSSTGPEVKLKVIQEFPVPVISDMEVSY
jgi:hypothetical protein